MKTIDERRELLQKYTGRFRIPQMTKPLKPGTCHNRVIEGCCTSYEFQIDTLSYRGIWISTIEDIELIVDGEQIPKSNMMFFCNGINYSIDNMVNHTECFWDAESPGMLRVYRVGGLPKGDHSFEITISKRSDFGHSFGNGTEGYEEAVEFHVPMKIHDECVYTIL